MVLVAASGGECLLRRPTAAAGPSPRTSLPQISCNATLFCCWDQVFETATVRRLDPALGLLCELPAAPGTVPLTPGYAHISNLADTPVKDLAQVCVKRGLRVCALACCWSTRPTFWLFPADRSYTRYFALPPRPCPHPQTGVPSGPVGAGTSSGLPPARRPGGAVAEALTGGPTHHGLGRWVCGW